MKIVAVIPAYNEETRIEQAIRDAGRFVDVVVVVDDCSLDNTYSEASGTPAHLLRHILNRGQGAALQTGTDYAVEKCGADIIVHFDADGQMAGDEIPTLTELIRNGEADVVLGSRFLGKQANMPLMRRITLWGGLMFTRIISGVATTDTHNGFRALSKNAAKKMRITLDRMAHASEILDLLQIHKLRYVERPVTIRYTKGTLAKGQSSLGAFVIVKDFIEKRLLG